MTPIGAAAASVPAAPTDPRELSLHLEICRLQAELEGLEARIHQVEAARAAGGSGYDPFVERAEELVERMVASLYVTGRAEIAEATASTDAEAEALVAEARRRAQAILDEARDELASVLVHRADAVEAAIGGVGGGVLDLTEPATLPPAVVAAPTESVVDEVTPVDDEPAPPSPPSMGAPIEEPLVAEASALVDEPPAPPVPPAPLAPLADAPAPPVAVAVAPAHEHQLPEGTVSALEAIAPHLPPMAPPAGAAAASDRTDAAFEAWLAVAPSPVPGPDTDAGPGADDEIVPSGARPAWVRPVEAVVALLMVAVLVVLTLLLVG